MKDSEYKQLIEFFDKYNLSDMDSVKFCWEHVLEKKLYQLIEKNGGEYKFRRPLKYYDLLNLFIKRGSILEMVSLKANKGGTDEFPVYSFEICLSNGEELHMGIDDYFNIHTILNYISEDEKYKQRITKSDYLYFDNEDIIITDPCYVTKDDDWEKSNYGQEMENLGIEHYLTHDTIYGDWSCTTFNKDTKEKIGCFCADAGLVSVFSLKEVLAYNPDFEDWIKNHSWCVTKIPNFTGKVFIDVKKRKNENFEVNVIGKGNINFITKQTGI